MKYELHQNWESNSRLGYSNIFEYSENKSALAVQSGLCRTRSDTIKGSCFSLATEICSDHYLSIIQFANLTIAVKTPTSVTCGEGTSGFHYANMSVQYTAIFHGCKNDNFQMKKCNSFLIFAQNIDRGYTLEPPQ